MRIYKEREREAFYTKCIWPDCNSLATLLLGHSQTGALLDGCLLTQVFLSLLAER